MNHHLCSRRSEMVRIGLGIGLVGMIVSGCGGDTTDAQPAPVTSAPTRTVAPRPTGAGGSPAVSQPATETVERSSADVVAEATLVTMYSYDTTIDTGPNDTARRALPWLSEQFAESVMQDRPVSGAGATWTEWADHDAYVTPTLAPGGDERPPDSATTARRQYQVTLSPTGRDGWVGQVEEQTVFVTLTNESTTEVSWAVEEVQVG